jgi:hypothetical protein
VARKGEAVFSEPYQPYTPGTGISSCPTIIAKHFIGWLHSIFNNHIILAFPIKRKILHRPVQAKMSTIPEDKQELRLREML